MVAVFIFYSVRHELFLSIVLMLPPILSNLIIWKRSRFRIFTIELPPTGWQNASTKYLGDGHTLEAVSKIMDSLGA